MKKLLFVDNEKDALVIYAAEFRNEGYKVTIAPNARQALEYFQVDRPDLVVLDIHLPGMDGLEAIGYMLSIDRTVPVIFASLDFHGQPFA